MCRNNRSIVPVLLCIFYLFFCYDDALGQSHVLKYSTYLGGPDSEYGEAITVDSAGNSYVAGICNSIDFPTTPGVYSGSSTGFGECFVTKMNTNGSALIFSTLLGGSEKDKGDDVAVDTAGNVYVTGYTESRDFPTTPGAYDTTPNGTYTAVTDDPFVFKLSADGSVLVYSTYLGGRYIDYGSALGVDNSGCVFVAGTTDSPDYPMTPGSVDSKKQNLEGFITKLSPDGSSLVYSTFLGGEGDDYITDLVIDDDGYAYVTGRTGSFQFPTLNAFDPLRNDGIVMMAFDVFVTKLNPLATGFAFSTFFGDKGPEEGNAITIDDAGHIYITGIINYPDFPITPDAYDTTWGGRNDVFVSKLTSDGAALFFSTFVGGSDGDTPTDIEVDSENNVYVTGYTSSTGFPTTPGALRTAWPGDPTAFLFKLSADGSDLLYSTFVAGSTGYSHVTSIAIDGDDAVYITGSTSDAEFPTTPSAFDRTHNGGYDVFISKLNLAASPSVPLSQRNVRVALVIVFTFILFIAFYFRFAFCAF